MSRDFVKASVEYFEVTSLGSIPTSVPLTMATWFHPDIVSAQDECLMQIADSASGNNWFEMLWVNGNVRAGDRSPTGQGMATSSNSVGTAKFSHACAIFAGDTDRTAVLDGDWANRGTETATTITPGSLDRLRIGYRADSSPNIPYDGRMAYAAIWSAALVQWEVEALAKGVLPWKIRPASLIACWPMNEPNSTDSAVDIIGGHTATDISSPGVGVTWPNLYNPEILNVSRVAASSITLSVDDISHSIAFDSPTLVQGFSLTVADVNHAVLIDSPTLTQGHSLAVDDITHSVSFESPTLIQGFALAVNDINHAVSFDTPALTQKHSLTVSDITHSLAFDNVTLTQKHALLVDDIAHAMLMDNVSLILPGDVTHEQLMNAINALSIKVESIPQRVWDEVL